MNALSYGEATGSPRRESDSGKAAAPVAELRDRIRHWQRNEGGKKYIHPLTTLAHLALMIAAVKTWNAGLWPATVVCWLAAAHLAHSKLIAFHEASHGTLYPNRRMNEFMGIVFGTMIWVPLSVYRCVHATHHAYLTSERDMDLWPFIDPKVPRWLRVTAAVVELTLGFFYTPVLFLHGVLATDRVPRAMRKRIVWEYALCPAVWGGVFTLLTVMHWWRPFLIGYFVQAFIAGNLQSIRKLTEHLGLFGDTILTATRTVVDKHRIGELLSASMLRIDYHGTHHRYAKIPYYHLPAATPYVYNGQVPALPLFPTYWHAMWDMFRGLGNPRVGPQWLQNTTRRTSAISIEARAPDNVADTTPTFATKAKAINDDNNADNHLQEDVSQFPKTSYADPSRPPFVAATAGQIGTAAKHSGP